MKVCILLSIVFLVKGEVNGTANDDYVTLGCYKDDLVSRAIPTLEGKERVLDGDFWTRTDAINKCYKAAKKRGYKVFALQAGGWCASSATAENTFNRYGQSFDCIRDGEGGPSANQVYLIKGRIFNPMIPSLEGTNNILDGSYENRPNAVAKCVLVARKNGFQMFEIRDDGLCGGSLTATEKFIFIDIYGNSNDCYIDDRRGINMIYFFEDFKGVGCYNDNPADRAIQTIEGTDSILGGEYLSRENPVAKCAIAAIKKGFHMFALQHGGWCAASATAMNTFDKYGKSTACLGDGEGGLDANQVYLIKDFKGVGCYNDTADRAIQTIEGTDSILDGDYLSRENPLAKCAIAAIKRGFHMFALQDGGWCTASATAIKTFDKYGKSTACLGDGEGGPWANNVYVIEDYKGLGCFKDGLDRAIPTIEGTDPVLDGVYWIRENPVAKCAVAARRNGFNVFSIQDGGRCATSATAEETYGIYGRSTDCIRGGKGGNLTSDVYVLDLDITPLGCYKDSAQQRAIPTMEGKSVILDGDYRIRENAMAKCAMVARGRGFHIFALQDGGWCATSDTAEETFYKYGKSSDCLSDGKGGNLANDVYAIKVYKNISVNESSPVHKNISVNESSPANKTISVTESSPVNKTISVNESSPGWKENDPITVNDSNSSSNKSALTAGIITGVVAAIVMGTVGATCKRKKSKQRQLRAVLVKRSKSDIVDLLQGEIPPERVTLMEELGRGAFGKVHRGVLRELPNAVVYKPKKERLEVKDGSVVAVKVLLETAGEVGKTQFLQEIEFMKKIGSHKNVLGMVGYWVKSEPIMLILEYVPHGDLLQWLRNKRQLISSPLYDDKRYTGEGKYERGTQVVDDTFKVVSVAVPLSEDDNVHHRKVVPMPLEHEEKKEESTIPCEVDDVDVNITVQSQNEQQADNDEDLSAEDLLCFAWQIAQGMDYLTRIGFVHRDLAARNVLLGEGRTVKISDFGLLRHTYGEIYEVKTTKKLPIKWTAPEALFYGRYTSKSDVWSFGVLLWELATMGGIPYPGISNKELYKLLKTGYRMDKPDMCSEEIYKLMVDCWKEYPNERPTFKEMISTLEEMMTRDTPYYDFDKLDENDACYEEVISDSSDTSLSQALC